MTIEIGNKEIKIPVIQGGMGIGVSLENLAGNVALNGGIGTISMINIGYEEEDFYKDPLTSNIEAFKKKYRQAKEISKSQGLILVNIMQVITDYERMVREAVKLGVDGIVVGAGLALNLPELVNEDILIAPIVSSKKALALMVRSWNKYGRYPDFVIVEGYEAGGHLGFKEDEIGRSDLALESIVTEVRDYLDQLYREKGIRIAFFAAGGLYDGYDLKKYQALGASGIQLGTRFIATRECDASQAFKDMIIKSSSKDLVIFKSPAGLPGRAISNGLIERSRKSPDLISSCSRCLRSCRPAKVDFCINKALVAAVKGDQDKGLFFAGKSIDKIRHLSSVREVLQSIEREWKE